jgi:L-serine dehydratase
MESISAFEIIKIGIGPSSSHTMGPWKAASMFLTELAKKTLLTNITELNVYLYGSLAKTGIGHGTDIAVLMGLSGEDFTTINTTTIPEKVERIKKAGKIKLK